MKINKTVYLEGGGTQLCGYDTDILTLAPLWITIFVISLALNVFAIIGNCIVIIACFLQKKKKPPLIIYIHALAFSDLMYALVAPFYTYRYVLPHWPHLIINFGLAGRLSHHTTMIGLTFATISSWLVVALTIDRLILFRSPFKATTLSTRKRAHIAVFLIILFCCAVNAVWLYELFEVPIIVDECTGYWSIPKVVEMPDGTEYVPIRYKQGYWIYAIVSAVLFMYALPTLIIIVSNVLIISALNGKSDTLSISSRVNRKRLLEIRLTKMIVVVSVCFVICNIPDIATRLLWKFISPLIVGKVQPIAHLFLMVNVGANFVVYSMFNKHLFTTIIELRNRLCGFCTSSDSIKSNASSSSSGSSGSSAKLHVSNSVSSAH